MKLDINLVTKAQEKVVAKRRIIWILTFSATGLLVVLFLVAVAIGSTSYISKKEIEKTQENIQQLQQNIGQYSAREQKQYLVVDRLNAAGQIQTNKPQLVRRLQKIIAAFPDSVEIKNIELNKDEDTATIDLASHTYTSFAESIDLLNNGEFSFVEITALKRKKNGDYNLAIKVSDQ